MASASMPTHCLLSSQTTTEPLSKLVHQTKFSGLPCPKRISTGLSVDVSNAAQSTPAFRLQVFNISDLTDNDAENANEQSFGDYSSSTYAMAPVMKRGYGAFGGGATLEKSKLDLSQSTSKVSPKTEDGGGGGDIGNRINHGGGDGGDDGGDDDDYFGDADDDDEGDDGGFFGRRLVLPEVFDRKIVEAILQEWFRTISDLPAGLRQAVELGIISSAQMARFISHFGRPTVARLLSRAIPPSFSRDFVGRMVADPSFLYKMVLEQGITISHGIWWEYKNRKERLKDEWVFAVGNVLSLSLCNAAIVWSLAPCRSYGSTFKFSLQSSIQKLPNNVFERNYAFREFDMLKRVQSLFYKAGELCLVGLVTGAISGSLMRSLASDRENLSVPVPTTKTSALGYGAFLGLSGNIRYQLIYGAEKVMQQQFNHLGVVVFLSTALRALNTYVGDATRVSWLGLDAREHVEGSASTTRKVTPQSVPKADGWLNIGSKVPLALFNGDTSSKSRKTRRKVKKRVVLAS